MRASMIFAALFAMLLVDSASNATPQRVRYTIRCTEVVDAKERVVYEARVEGEPSTDFDIALRDARVAVTASFVNEPAANGVDTRVRIETRRRFGNSPNGLPLWEEDRQQHRFTVGFDQQIEFLPFGGAGERGLLRLQIVPDAVATSAKPLDIAIDKLASDAITVRAYRVPHWYTIDATLLQHGAIRARATSRVFLDEPARIVIGDVRLTLTASSPSHADPRTTTLLRFDGARNGKTFARHWEGIMTNEPLRYPLGDGWTLQLDARPQ
ncbi:MAG TPA: hypothetical protein VF787_19135 [Thermoanaerobaculia bacterium]